MKSIIISCLVIFFSCFTNLFCQGDYLNTQNSSSTFLVKGNHSINFDFHQITDVKNGYKLQSNGSPQQLWVDLNNPEFLHAVFTNSQWKDPPFPDRASFYFGSTDSGIDWWKLGSVPDTSRSGFSAIYGTSEGAAVIVNHSTFFDQTTRTGLFIDSLPFYNGFAAYDPGIQLEALWPRCLVLSSGKVLIAASSSGNLALNFFDPDSSSFSGWLIVAPTGPETYSLAQSSLGKIGITFLGDGVDDGDVFYFETTNEGITWSPTIKIFDRPDNQNIALGSFRGISLSFFGEEPCVVFEVVKQDFNSSIFYPREPSEIHFWSPNINGGISKAIADSNNVPFAPNLTSTEVFAPLSRPVISRSQTDDYLFVAFSAATNDVYVGADSTTYFAGYFMYSSNGGNTWAEPDKFTPETPLLDWKYISIAPVIPVIENTYYINMVLQGDSLVSSPNPLFLSAKYFHTSTVFPVVHVDEGPFAVIDFKLEQNYPNPFNPNTTISYSVPSSSFTKLKVYDVLGNEVATLVNEEKPAGIYEVSFNAEKLTSGVYFYKLTSGSFVNTKKMLLLK